MQVELFKEYRFEAAHLLPKVAPGHKCGRLHGHSFSFEIEVRGPIDETKGWLIDYGDLDGVVMPIVNQLDHYYLNEIKGLENPTSENLAVWLYHKIRAGLPELVAVSVRETCDARCVFRGA